MLFFHHEVYWLSKDCISNRTKELKDEIHKTFTRNDDRKFLELLQD